jgi:hypothetical protein
LISEQSSHGWVSADEPSQRSFCRWFLKKRSASEGKALVVSGASLPIINLTYIKSFVAFRAINAKIVYMIVIVKAVLTYQTCALAQIVIVFRVQLTDTRSALRGLNGNLAIPV